MVAPLLRFAPFKSSSALRGYARNNIYTTYDKKVSARQIIRDMRSAGLGYNNTLMNADIRRVKGLEKFEAQLTTLRGESLVPKAFMSTDHGKNIGQQAQYRFKMTVTNLATGDQETIVRAIATDKHYTKSEAEEQLGGQFLVPNETSNFTIEDIKLFEVWVREDMDLHR